MRGRAVIRRLLLALILLAPGTPAIVAQDVAAHAATQPQTVSVAALSAASAPPDDRLHLAALPTPSGASPAYPLNHSFDGQLRALGGLVTNADFETPGTSVGTPPTNSDLSAASTTVGIPPTNADFATGDFSGWMVAGAPTITSDSTHGLWAKLSSSGAAITSAPFTVDSAAQAFTFDLNNLSTGSALNVYILTGPDYSTSTKLAYLYCGCAGWRTIALDASAYLGQSVKLRFAYYLGGEGIDNLHLTQVLPDYQLTGSVERATEPNGNVYARVNSGSLTSAPFTVDRTAQYLNVQLKGLTSASDQYYLKVLSGADFSTVTQISAGVVADDAWYRFHANAAAWRGQTIELQVIQAYGDIGVDDVGLQVIDIPGWELSGDSSLLADASGDHYVSTNGSLTSTAFTVSAETQQFSLRYRNQTNSTFYVELLSGADFGTVTQLDYLAAAGVTDWTTLTYSLGPFSGQTIKLRLHQWFGRGQYDDLGLGEQVLPGWTTTTTDGLALGSDSHGSYVTPSKSGGAMFLASSTIAPGIIDRSASADMKFYAISYDIGYHTADLFQVFWVDPTGTSWTIFQDAADTPTGYRTRYLWLADTMGASGHFVIKDTGGGRVYSIADNIARQQLNEPFARKVGLAIDTPSGSFGYHEQDLAIQEALPVNFSRYYVAQSDQYGELGFRWSHSYDTHLVLDGSGNAGVVFGSGAEEFFAWNGAHQTFAPADARVHDTLAKNGDGNYTFSTKTNLSYYFDATGRLTSIADLDGNTLALTYDANGRLGSVTDPAGNSLTLAYDAQGRLSSVTDPVGAVVSYGYDANGDLASVTDPLGHQRGYTYDQHRLTQVVDQNGKTLFTNTYDDVHRVTSQTDALGTTITLDYDTPGLGATQVTDPNGAHATYYFDQYQRTTDQVDPQEHVISYRYDAVGNLQTVIDPAFNQWQFAYDADADLTGQTDPLSNPIQISYNPQHLPTTIQDARGNVTTLTYDAAGHVLTQTDPDNQVTGYTYDAHGFLASMTNPLNQTESYSNDAQGHRLSRTDALGHSWQWTYDAAGHLTSETDPNQHTTTYIYDLFGRIITIEDATGHEQHFLYDFVGHLLMAENQLGQQTFWGYDDRGLVSSKTDPAGKITSYSYDDNRNMTAVTDPLGHTTSYSYDALNRLIAVTDPLNHTTTYSYDDAGRLASVTDPLNRVTSYGYDAAGHLTSQTLPNGGVSSFSYDADGNRVTEADPLNHTTSYSYDALSRLVSVTDALNHTTTYSYDAAGRQLQLVDALNQVTSYGYDAAGRLTSVTDPLSHVTSYGYDAAGNRTSVTDPNNHTTSYAYDALNRLLSITDPLNQTTAYNYDGAGRQTAVTDPLNHTTSYAYDVRGLLTSVTDPLNRVTRYAYDDAGQRISQTNPRDATTSYGYDAAGRLTTLTDQYNGVVQFSYDAAGQQIAVTDPRGKVTSYGYDALGDVLTTTDPLNRVQRSTYDLAGQLTGTTDARNVSVGYSYDAAGNLTGVTYPGGSISYGFDALNRQVAMTDSTGTTSYGYDAASRLTSIVSPAGTLSYGYDAAGQRTSLTLPGNQTVSYGYDAAGQLTSLTDWNQQTIGYGYDAAGKQTSINRPNGVDTAETYDAAGQLTGITHSTASGTLQSFAYTLDGAGNRVAVTSTAGTETYTFDLLNRVTEVVEPNGDTVDYSYDAAGNRLTQTVNGATTSSSYDDAGQLTSAGGTSYSYDANGNLTAAGADSYSWDWGNELTSATVGGTSASYTYDGAGTRVGANVDGTTSTELWDTADDLPRLVDDGTTSYLQTDGLQAAISASGTTYPLTDALGSVRGLTDASGNLVGISDYAVFGAVRGQSGTSLSFGYTGQQTDATGLVYLRARELDPSLGRFLSPDTVQPNAPGSQGYNLYAYAANNPTTWVDPTGNAVSALAEGILFLGTACLMFRWCRNPLFDGVVRLNAGVESGDLPMAAGGFAESVFSLIACALDLVCLHLAQFMAAIVNQYGSSGPASTTGTNPVPATPQPSGGLAGTGGAQHAPTIPQAAFYVYNFAKDHNWSPPPYYVGGSVFRDDNHDLPAGGDYREYDIHPKPAPNTGGRRPERIVIDIKTGKAWYSPNHYGQKKDGNPPFIPMN